MSFKETFETAKDENRITDLYESAKKLGIPPELYRILFYEHRMGYKHLIFFTLSRILSSFAIFSRYMEQSFITNMLLLVGNTVDIGNTAYLKAMDEDIVRNILIPDFESFLSKLDDATLLENKRIINNYYLNCIQIWSIYNNVLGRIVYILSGIAYPFMMSPEIRNVKVVFVTLIYLVIEIFIRYKFIGSRKDSTIEESDRLKNKVLHMVDELIDNNNIIIEHGTIKEHASDIASVIDEFVRMLYKDEIFISSEFMVGEYQYDIIEKFLFVIVKNLIPYNAYIYDVLFSIMPYILKDIIVTLQELKDRMADNRGYEKIMAIEPVDDSFYIPLYSESEILFKVEGLSKRYGDVIVFDNASVILPSRKWISFLGNSGGGKSTFSRMILAKERHDSGEILFQGEHSNYNYKNIRDAVSYVKNKDDLFNNSIFYNLTYGVKIEKNVIDQIRYYLNLFGIEKIDLKANINTLSSGQQQRIKVIRMIIEDKPIWILDESTSNIDNTMENIVVSELRRIQSQKNKSVLHITHNVENTLIADMVMRIEDAKLVFV